MDQKSGSVERIDIVPLRNAFPNEARDLTRWLERQIDALAERLGLSLSVVQREQKVGDFILDLLCKDADGRLVIIENQLERTDHSHLGQLLTYLVNLEAKIAIWVAADPRAEHEKVIEWLNESTPVGFYLVKVEAIRIGASPFAPLFTVLAQPNKQAREVGEKKKEWAEGDQSRYEFWKQLLEGSKSKTKLFANISPGRSNWISAGAGRSGLALNYTLLKNEAGIELYIDQVTAQKNKAFFDKLFAQKEVIEREFGGPLEWERLDDKRACRIRKRFSAGGLNTPDVWPSLQDAMINAMIRFEMALRPYLNQIEV